MLYEIRFSRSTNCHSTRPSLQAQILSELRGAGVPNLPAVCDWTFPCHDEETGQSEIYARFWNPLPLTEVQVLFEQAKHAGMQGDFSLHALPDAFHAQSALN